MSDVRFDGQVVLVTGAGRGMGRSHVLELARRGAAVVVNDIAGSGGSVSPDSAQSVVEEISATGGSALANTDDISTSAGCEAAVAAAVERFGRIDAIIHNAGTVTMVPITEMTDAAIEPTLRVHLLGAIHLTRAAWPHFVSQGGGRMLYITSAAGLYGVPGFSHYGPAKTALVSLARVVALEGATLGIRANALGVAAMTKMMETMFAQDMIAERATEAQWWREHMRPEQVSPAALWLIHPDCTANGRVYQSRGGRVARVVIVESRGFIDPDHTVEDVRDHFDEVEDLSERIVVEESADLIKIERRWLEELAQRQSRADAKPDGS